MWLYFFAVDSMFESEAFHLLISHFFSSTAFLDIDAVLLLLPQSLGISGPASDVFEPLPRMDRPKSNYSRSGASQHHLFDLLGVYACSRDKLQPMASVRAARVEDHDDLVPIFNEQTQVLTQVYGQFYLADLIAAQNTENKTLVLEVRLF